MNDFESKTISNTKILTAIEKLREKYNQREKSYDVELVKNFLKMIKVTSFSKKYEYKFTTTMTKEDIDGKYEDFLNKFATGNDDESNLANKNNLISECNASIKSLLNNQAENSRELAPQKLKCVLITFLLYENGLLEPSDVNPEYCLDFLIAYFGEDKLYPKEPNDIILHQMMFRIKNIPEKDTSKSDLYFKYIFLFGAFNEYLKNNKIKIGKVSDASTLDRYNSDEWREELDDEHLWTIMVNQMEIYAHYRNTLKNHILKITNTDITKFTFDLQTFYDTIYLNIDLDKDETYSSNYLFDHLFEDLIIEGNPLYYQKTHGKMQINRRDFLLYYLYYFLAKLHNSKDTNDIRENTNIDKFFAKVDMEIEPFFEPPIISDDYLSNAFTRGIFSISYLYCLICGNSEERVFTDNDTNVIYLREFLSNKEYKLANNNAFKMKITTTSIEFTVCNNSIVFELNSMKPSRFVHMFENYHSDDAKKYEKYMGLLIECLSVYCIDSQFPKRMGDSYKDAL